MILGRSLKQFRRGAMIWRAQFSGKTGEKTKGFDRVLKFISSNRQQLLNVMAVYFVFSFSVHNFRMQEAWKEQEKTLIEVSNDLKAIKEKFEDDAWYDSAAVALQGTKDIKGTLKSLVQANLSQKSSDDEESSAQHDMPDLSPMLNDPGKKPNNMI